MKNHTATVLLQSFFSAALGIEKKYCLYLPPGYRQSNRRYAVLYLFRGHEQEWFDRYMDKSRGGRAVQDLLDEMIAAGKIPPIIAVGVGLTSDDHQVYGLGVNFLNPAAAGGHPGIGSGLWERYLRHDLISHIDNTYRSIPDSAARAADGFSLGGYTAVMLAIKHPGLFGAVGSYDGSHMFHNLNDPRLPGDRPDDSLWLREDAMFAPAFRRKGRKNYDHDYILSYNPLNLLDNMPTAQKSILRKTRFSIRSAAGDGMAGNRDRALHLLTLLNRHGIANTAGHLVLSEAAGHTWKDADRHLRENLPVFFNHHREQ